jgi:hypothetical protein
MKDEDGMVVVVVVLDGMVDFGNYWWDGPSAERSGAKKFLIPSAQGGFIHWRKRESNHSLLY